MFGIPVEEDGEAFGVYTLSDRGVCKAGSGLDD